MYCLCQADGSKLTGRSGQKVRRYLTDLGRTMVVAELLKRVQEGHVDKRPTKRQMTAARDEVSDKYKIHRDTVKNIWEDKSVAQDVRKLLPSGVYGIDPNKDSMWRSVTAKI